MFRAFLFGICVVSSRYFALLVHRMDFPRCHFEYRSQNDVPRSDIRKPGNRLYQWFWVHSG